MFTLPDDEPDEIDLPSPATPAPSSPTARRCRPASAASPRPSPRMLADRRRRRLRHPLRDVHDRAHAPAPGRQGHQRPQGPVRRDVDHHLRPGHRRAERVPRRQRRGAVPARRGGQRARGHRPQPPDGDHQRCPDHRPVGPGRGRHHRGRASSRASAATRTSCRSPGFELEDRSLLCLPSTAGGRRPADQPHRRPSWPPARWSPRPATSSTWSSPSTASPRCAAAPCASGRRRWPRIAHPDFRDELSAQAARVARLSRQVTVSTIVWEHGATRLSDDHDGVAVDARRRCRSRCRPRDRTRAQGGAGPLLAVELRPGPLTDTVIGTSAVDRPGQVRGAEAVVSQGAGVWAPSERDRILTVSEVHSSGSTGGGGGDLLGGRGGDPLPWSSWSEPLTLAGWSWSPPLGVPWRRRSGSCRRRCWACSRSWWAPRWWSSGWPCCGRVLLAAARWAASRRADDHGDGGDGHEDQPFWEPAVLRGGGPRPCACWRR